MCVTGVMLNSYWSEADGCSVQYYHCKGCQLTNQQAPVIAAEIKATTHSNYTAGQVRRSLIIICCRALYRMEVYRLYRYFGYTVHIVSFILVKQYFKQCIFA